MKKILGIIVAIVIIVAGVFGVKEYSNSRYVISDTYYTQIPLDIYQNLPNVIYQFTHTARYIFI